MEMKLQGVLCVLFLLFAPAVWASVNINTADATALDALPGIGPAKAQAVLEYRQAHGPFRSVDELTSVHGIGPRLLERLRPVLSLDGATTLPQTAARHPGHSHTAVPTGEERVVRHGSHGYILESGPRTNAFSLKD
ncbi:ComEA family DNA-binding protein [Acidithiobacillus ferrooxidans]|jgi:competence protein ComEA|uniref:ComEA family DNA-binding protein n=1 Tax=Acidithiobacillus ferrooxidans TaxID=920 RepID=UPI0013D1C82C|nr:ComEA family DNA-binding protein [Acidithiobacillus ferrooxidans]MBU2855479.1 ComEA family DNA-binding protein [Acidithiobacillus ferrooxidans]MBU2860936.1 ComEA family DNA-binding protein [Acidithiobacillus ferrooxidans]MCR2831493.1 ComEA family DNA-binding protein [Acidithiobacillus ferrooxidans]